MQMQWFSFSDVQPCHRFLASLCAETVGVENEEYNLQLSLITEDTSLDACRELVDL